MPSLLTSPVAQLNDSPALQHMQRTLRHHFTRLWPTRRVALCPPAFAGYIDSSTLDVPVLRAACPQRKSLVVFLPDQFSEYLGALAWQAPVLRVHPDISRARQRAYVSWSCPNPGLPLTVWLELEPLMEALLEQDMTGTDLVLPVVFVAGDSVAVGKMTLDDGASPALAVAAQPLPALDAVAQRKLDDKAASYSEQPWLFMRYELSNGGRRYAVHLAPLLRLDETA